MVARRGEKKEKVACIIYSCHHKVLHKLGAIRDEIPDLAKNRVTQYMYRSDKRILGTFGGLIFILGSAPSSGLKIRAPALLI